MIFLTGVCNPCRMEYMQHYFFFFCEELKQKREKWNNLCHTFNVSINAIQNHELFTTAALKVDKSTS